MLELSKGLKGKWYRPKIYPKKGKFAPEFLIEPLNSMNFIEVGLHTDVSSNKNGALIPETAAAGMEKAIRLSVKDWRNVVEIEDPEKKIDFDIDLLLNQSGVEVSGLISDLFSEIMDYNGITLEEKKS